jgi:hypothetical protein
MTAKVAPLDPDPDFPGLPRVPDKERRGWGEAQKWHWHLQEVGANAKHFDRRRRERMRGGMPELDAALEAALEVAKMPLPWRTASGEAIGNA